jgi:hypothetical protein
MEFWILVIRHSDFFRHSSFVITCVWLLAYQNSLRDGRRANARKNFQPLGRAWVSSGRMELWGTAAA